MRYVIKRSERAYSPAAGMYYCGYTTFSFDKSKAKTYDNVRQAQNAARRHACGIVEIFGDDFCECYIVGR